MHPELPVALDPLLLPRGFKDEQCVCCRQGIYTLTGGHEENTQAWEEPWGPLHRVHAGPRLRVFGLRRAHSLAPEGLPLPSPPKHLLRPSSQLSLPSCPGPVCLLSHLQWFSTAVKSCPWSLGWKLDTNDVNRKHQPSKLALGHLPPTDPMPQTCLDLGALSPGTRGCWPCSH